MNHYICHKCGGELFQRVRPCTGIWMETVHFNEDGTSTVEESNMDGAMSGPEPILMRCESCNASQPNPEHPDWNPSKERLFTKLLAEHALKTITPHGAVVLGILSLKRSLR